MADRRRGSSGRRAGVAGFSLIEVLASVLLITLLMAAVFAFMYQAQRRYQANLVTSESNQSARAALEVMTQEIGQAGYNPNLPANRNLTQAVTGSSTAQCVTLDSTEWIHPGDWLSVDSGPNHEMVQVTGTTASGACSSPNQVKGLFLQNHPASAGPPATPPFPVIAYKMPYPGGILAPGAGTNYSNDHTLKFFGDIENDLDAGEAQNIKYVVYSLAAASPAATVNISASQSSCPGTYTLYNLQRSITPLNFTTGTVQNTSYTLVPNVLYDMTNKQGPTCQPIFGYPNPVTVGIAPNQIAVIGTLIVTISVAVSPKSLETAGITQWYTMATQIRPINLAAAVETNLAGGFKYLPPIPADLYPTAP